MKIYIFMEKEQLTNKILSEFWLQQLKEQHPAGGALSTVYIELLNTTQQAWKAVGYSLSLLLMA